MTPREIDHLQLHQFGRLAQYRLARGLKLNLPESIALITSVMMEKIRDGDTSVSDLMTMGQSLLGLRQVQPGVASMVKDVQIEATFPDGTKLLTVHSPISKTDGDLELALEGSFLPVPDLSVFGDDTEVDYDTKPPGAVTVADDNDDTTAKITLNADRIHTLIELSVTNTGDRPVQVGSHYAFLETNKALVFDRRVSIGKRLNIPSGASVRFEPGETKTVTLVDIGGSKIVISGNRLHEGGTNEDEIMARVKAQGFGHATALEVPAGKPLVVERSSYADIYGPTVGDTIKLGDTELEIQVERDLTTYGEECKFGGGKTLREGMGQVRIDMCMCVYYVHSSSTIYCIGVIICIIIFVNSFPIVHCFDANFFLCYIPSFVCSFLSLSCNRSLLPQFPHNSRRALVPTGPSTWSSPTR